MSLKRALVNLGSAFCALLLLMPLDAVAQALKCVASVCADGYQGCGCGPESEECCRRRMTRDSNESTDANTARPDTTVFDEMMKATLQKSMENMQNQQELIRQQQAEQQRQMQQKMMQGAEQSEKERVLLEGKMKRSQADRTRRKKLERTSLAKELGWDQEAVPGLSLDSLATGATARSENSDDPMESEATGLDLVACVAPPEEATVHTCRTLTCGGTDQRPVCCPMGSPYLNHCDCLCYRSRSEVDCDSYSACQYDYRSDQE